MDAAVGYFIDTLLILYWYLIENYSEDDSGRENNRLDKQLT